jgi:hypothetical protein
MRNFIRNGFGKGQENERGSLDFPGVGCFANGRLSGEIGTEYGKKI